MNKMIFFLGASIFLTSCGHERLAPVEQDNVPDTNDPTYQLFEAQITDVHYSNPPRISIKPRIEPDRKGIFLTWNEPWILRHFGDKRSALKEFVVQFKARIKSGFKYAIAPIELDYKTTHLRKGSHVRLIVSTSLNGWSPQGTDQYYFKPKDEDNQEPSSFEINLNSPESPSWSRCYPKDSSVLVKVKFRLESLASPEDINELSTELFWVNVNSPQIKLRAQSCR